MISPRAKYINILTPAETFHIRTVTVVIIVKSKSMIGKQLQFSSSNPFITININVLNLRLLHS
jgi:hypothetical protein